MKVVSIYPNLIALKWLLLSLLLVTIPHIGYLAWWVMPAFLGLMLWRYFITLHKQPIPIVLVRFLIAVMALVGVFLSYQTLLGRDAGVSLLVVLIGLKLIEMRNHRDALLVCFLGYFLIITNFLYSQSIPTALYMLVVLLVMTITLISLNDTNRAMNIQQKSKLAATILLQATPIMLILFLLFPRMPGPFWSLPESSTAKTGLSDSMSIGNISQLTQSDEIAFRVKFHGEVPAKSKLYWRGPVLWWTDGRDWHVLYRHALPDDGHQINHQAIGENYRYTVTLEPHDQAWLFALDLPSYAPAPISNMTQDYQILAKFPVRQLLRYEVSSVLDYKAMAITSRQLPIALRLPAEKHPKTIALARSWRQQGYSDLEIVQQGLAYFNLEPFYYTLNPSLLTGDVIDEFLFNTRQGFCEHYAAAYVTLMRAAGIPARVVTGYQGGEMNPLGDYLIVRQRDAHAWTEVWLGENGWVRIDPTAAVSPDRVELGIDSAIPQQFTRFGMEFSAHSGVVQAWQQFSRALDAMNNGWNQWILGYGAEHQRELFKRFGFEQINWQQMGIILVFGVIIIIAGLGLWMWLQPRHRNDAALRYYLRFCRKAVRRYAIEYKSHETASQFAQRLIAIRPELKTQIENIINLYLETRYNQHCERGAASAEHLHKLTCLKYAVRKF